MDGNLSLKSSVLSPVSRRIFDQFDAFHQLKSHHKRVGQIKPVVDTSPPKSLNKSVVRKDQKQRSQLSSRSSSRTHSRVSSTSLSKSLETLPNSQSIPKEHSSSHSHCKSRSSGIASKIGWYLEAIQQTALPLMPMNKLQEAALFYNSPYAKTNSKSAVMTGLHNTRHKGCFENSMQPFFPKPPVHNKVESKIRKMEHCYNPATSFKRPVTRKAAAQEALNLEYLLQEHLRQLEHQETCYEKWLQDQAQRAEVRKEALTSRAGSISHLKQSKHTASSLHTPHLHLRSSDSGRETDRSSLKILPCREEEKQLEFVAAITEDILRSGLFSDSAIKHTIKLHLDEKSQDLGEEQVQLLVNQLMNDLCINGEPKYTTYNSILNR